MSKTILIVEDDPDVRNGLHIRLKANGYVTVLAADAPSSISQARKHAPDLIVLDLGLPGGDGFLVMDRFKPNPTLAVIPIIIVSSPASHPNHHQSLKYARKTFIALQAT